MESQSNMYNFDKILVALDHTDIDDELIHAASFVSMASKSSHVHFVNVIKDITLPPALKKEFPNLMKDAVKERKSEISLKVEKYFSNENTKVHIEITNGNPTKAILKHSLSKDVDLIIMGRKNESKGGGVIINRIARRAACSLLIFPKGFNQQIRKLLIPIDFSDHSLKALSKAIKLAESNAPDLEIIAQNVYQVPSGYHYTGKSFKEFAAIMRDNIDADYKKWSKKLPKNNLNLKPLYTLDRHDDIITSIYNTAIKSKADAIIISAKGRTSTTALFLGSKAEKMIQLDSELPLVVLRPKGRQEGILEYLKQL